MCCACQGPPPTSFPKPSLNLLGSYECANTDIGVGDTWGDGCEWYADSQDYCGHYDDVDFVAGDMCCGCGGGTASVCTDSGADTSGDATGDHCEWYTEYPSGCGMYDTDDFHSNEMCCACKSDCNDSEGETRDWGGDSCSWYADNVDWCGWYDDDDFTAADVCCACSKADKAWLNLDSAEAGCIDTDSTTGNSDIGGDGCSWYNSNPDYCGVFDTASFVTSDECCGCGGGMYYGNACADLDEGSGGDITGDTCDWYNDNTYACG